MKKQTFLYFLLASVFMLSACQNNPAKDKSTQKEQRIISLNGAITGIVYELGHGQELVGVDVTSTYPTWIKDSVKVMGHVRSLNIESVMALHPTLILASAEDMSPKLKKGLQDSGIKFKLFKQESTIKGTKKLIKSVAKLLGETKNQDSLISKIEDDLAKVEPFDQKPKVLFIYARGAGTLMVAGKDTPIAHTIQLAGAQNAVTAFKNFKPLTEEALLNINPDVILLFNSGLQSLGGEAGLLKAVPAVAQTKAGKNKAIITMNGGLLNNFGPRIGQGVYKLHQLLKPYAK